MMLSGTSGMACPPCCPALPIDAPPFRNPDTMIEEDIEDDHERGDERDVDNYDHDDKDEVMGMPPTGPARRLAMLSRHMTDTSPDVAGKPMTWLITGVTSGLGRALAVECAKRGFRVVGCGRRQERLKSLKDEIAGNGLEHVLLTCDVTDKEDVSRFHEQVAAKGVVPDVCWANSGVSLRPAPLWKVKTEDFDRLMKINVNGVFYVIKAFLPDMLKASHGEGSPLKRILGTSSGLGHSSSPVVGTYSASKWAVEALMKSLAQALAKDTNIAAYPLAPGVIRTEMMRREDMPSAEQWSKDAVAYVLSLNKEQSGSSVTIPGYYSDEYKATWILPDGAKLPKQVVAPFAKRSKD